MCKRPISYEAADELDQLITKCDEKEKNKQNKTNCCNRRWHDVGNQ
jgi:hypothetical protein